VRCHTPARHPDIEAQLAPNNYTYVHSLTYTYDNFTNTGILNTLAVTKNWMVQLGVVVGTETIQNDRFDWGFRFSGMYGVDYRYTTAYGLFSYQLLNHNFVNGYDFPMEYVDLQLSWSRHTAIP
jgi:hypothetical protein